ncbi:MAG: SDR family oxidoreductase [Gammaproteobacteria bacterium]|nr:SDR family oxidoreductase [Gammaproteobacteria bacterium]
MRKTVLITGASRGIGAETANLFAREGFLVYLNYKSNDLAVEQVKASIEEEGGECILLKADVSKEAGVSELFARIDSEVGYLSVLVNNVGVLYQQCRMDEITPQRFMNVLQTNVLSTFMCAKAAVKLMSKKYGGRGGVIINVSSGASKTGAPNEYVDYAASKGAIDSLTRGLALEVADEGVRVNGVRPGLIYTDIHADGGEEARGNRLKSRIPMQRGGKPTEVAEAIYWLASEKSSFVNGSFIDVTGGL